MVCRHRRRNALGVTCLSAYGANSSDGLDNLKLPTAAEVRASGITMSPRSAIDPNRT
jgi:hypothetical protein